MGNSDIYGGNSDGIVGTLTFMVDAVRQKGQDDARANYVEYFARKKEWLGVATGCQNTILCRLSSADYVSKHDLKFVRIRAVFCVQKKLGAGAIK